MTIRDTVAFSNISCVLMDIEGTTSSIKFVYDILFPYVRENVSQYLQDEWTTPKTQDAVETMAHDAGFADSSSWFAAVQSDVKASQSLVVSEVNKLMDQDIKATGLKKLQGLIWDGGYQSGTLRSHVYEDVPVALKAWKAAGIDLRIYSSGSAHAQQIFFANTEYGAFTDYFSAFYDTTIGAKREAASYTAIGKDTGFSPAQILFLSDVPAELEAARSAGIHTCLVYRPGNVSSDYAPLVESFADVAFILD